MNHKNRRHLLALLLSTCCLFAIDSSGLMAQGFSSPYFHWPLPDGGAIYDQQPLGFEYPSNQYWYHEDIGNQMWETMDINGDLLPDMVVTGENVTSTYFATVFGFGTNPYWKVFLNNGNGFDSVAVQWPVPLGGHLNHGFHVTHYDEYQLTAATGHQTWTIQDMDGDHRPDLVVVSEVGDSFPAFSVFSPDLNPHWKVYLNNGAGFNTTEVQWALPMAGYAYQGHLVGFSHYGYYVENGNEEPRAWIHRDMDGDLRKDLVVASHSISGSMYLHPFGDSLHPYWKVYRNQGNGFDTAAIAWPVPHGGGRTLAGEALGFNGSFGSTFGQDVGGEAWEMLDMNHDSLPDIVVTSVKDSSSAMFSIAIGLGSNPHWRVFLNNGQGFDSVAISWQVPPGGLKEDGIEYGFLSTKHHYYASHDEGSMAWDVLDLNADGYPDLVVTAQYDFYMHSFSPDNFPHWEVYFGSSQGFALSPYHFPIPGGGVGYWNNGSVGPGFPYADGFNQGLGHYATLNWDVLDLNGDRLPDFVATSIWQDFPGASLAGHTAAFDNGTDPHWRVFWNSSAAVGEAEPQTTVELAIYPIPATDVLHIDAIAANGTLRIVDLQGRSIYAAEVLRGETLAIPVAAYASGLYLVEFTHAKGRICKKVVVE